MLPLHQRCSHLVIIQWETVLLCQKLIDDRREKVQRENAAPKQSPTDHNCIVRESTHVNSLEGYYATAIPTMLTWTLVKIQGVTVLFCQKLINNRRAKCRERTQHQNIYWRMTIASYGNRIRVNSFEGYYATTTPTMLTWIFVIIQWETVLLRQKLFDNRTAKAQRKNAALKQSPTDDNVSYGNGTHIKSLEGYYATTTPRMLTWTLVKIQGVTVLFCQKLIDDRKAKSRERTQHQNIYWRMTIASYGNRTRVNSLEGYYATTTPTMLTSCDYTMRNSPLVSKTDWRSERKSAERKRCTKTIANGSQLHRTGIDPCQ